MQELQKMENTLEGCYHALGGCLTWLGKLNLPGGQFPMFSFSSLLCFEKQIPSFSSILRIYTLC